MGIAIGIDLGTTNSVACYYDGNNQPRVLLNANHEELTPSVVSYQAFDEDDDDAELVVGRPAVNGAKMYHQNTIYSIKRLMGRRFDDKNVQKWKKRINYTIAESQEPEPGLATVMMGGKQYLPEEISAMILSSIKKYSETALGEEVTHAVITIPAYFGEPERRATKEAGKKAGLVVKTLVAEPTAAALAFGNQLQPEEGRFILVFDLGGGTFDISIISQVDNDYNVMEIHGDKFLGGDDFDEEIVKMLLKHIQEKYEVDLSQDSRFHIVAKGEAEAAKKSLSSSDTVSIVVPEAAKANDKPINLKLKISRQEFERAIKPLVQRCKSLVYEAIEQQSLTPDLISDVLLVGGSTAVPLVYQTIESIFGKEKIRREVNPMHCVAMGAAILAHSMKGIECPECQTLCDESETTCHNCGASLAVAQSITDTIELTDITANHFGIEVFSEEKGNTFSVIIERGEVLPMSEPKWKNYYTTEQGQSHLSIPVYEGASNTNIEKNTKIGTIEYPLPEGLPKKHPVQVGLKLDRQSIVKVTIQVDGKDWGKDEELKRGDSAPHDSVTKLDDDLEDEDFITLTYYIQYTKSFLKDYEQILEPRQKERLEQAIEEAEDVLSDEKADKRNAVNKLYKILSRCGTASLIARAKYAANLTDEVTAYRLNQAAEELKIAAEDGNTIFVEELTDPLLSLVIQVERKYAEIKGIDSSTTGNLLREF